MPSAGDPKNVRNSIPLLSFQTHTNATVCIELTNICFAFLHKSHIHMCTYVYHSSAATPTITKTHKTETNHCDSYDTNKYKHILITMRFVSDEHANVNVESVDCLKVKKMSRWRMMRIPNGDAFVEPRGRLVYCRSPCIHTRRSNIGVNISHIKVKTSAAQLHTYTYSYKNTVA